MKIKELIELLQKRDENATVYINTKDGYEQLGRVVDGKYFNTVSIATKVSLTIDQAEQMLYQLASYDNLTPENTDDISRILGQDRVEEILSEIKHYQEEMQKVRSQVDTSVSFGDEDDTECIGNNCCDGEDCECEEKEGCDVDCKACLHKE
jgi:GTP1/Obg family GTP-binding protein